MTIGQRIAQKRKELGLSQEALGEELGVSRQSIYKWESDAALPEVEKLVTLSRLFGVSVGWLLGVEEGAAEQSATPEQAAAPEQTAAPEQSGELTEAQLKMVEEIVNRYLAAQPKPKPRRKWPWVVVFFAAVIALFTLFDRLEEIGNQYRSLQNSVASVTHSVDSQIRGISNRVEEILKAQNALTAEYGAEQTAVDYARNTITFSAYATPKTYVEGMEAVFLADSGDGPAEYPAELGPGRKFSGEVTTVLTDSITLSVVFISPDGTRQTQLLDSWTNLYSSSMPEADVDSFDLWHEEVTDGVLHIYNRYATIRGEAPGKGGAEVAEMQVGLFKNYQLLGWAVPCEQPEHFHGFDDHSFYRLPDMDIELTEDDRIFVAALITDEYGRQTVRANIPFVLNDEGDRLTYPSNGTYSPDPADWVFA